MVEVKADALEESFDAILQGERIAGLEARINEIDAAVKARAVAAARPPLDGVKGAGVDPQRVRKGLEAGVELKSFSGASGGAGGYAVPREIDAMVDSALNFRGEPYLPGNDLLTRYPGA
jgi:predicted phage gp36 major capsid-like protein